MEDERKTKNQLIEELNELRQCVAELQGFEEEVNQTRANQEKFTKAFRQNLIPMTIATVKDGRFVDASDAFLRLVELKREEVIGHTSRETGLITEEQRTIFYNELSKNGRIENLEMEVSPRDRGLRYGLFNVVRITFNNENYLLTTIQDITDRKLIEKTLQKREDHLREVLENSLEVSYKLNFHTNHYDYLSPVIVKISGYTRDEIEPLPFEKIMDFIHPDDHAEIGRVIAESNSGAVGTEYQMNYRFKHKNGQYRWCQDRFTVMRDAGGHPLAIIGNVSDITERKQAENVLKESEKNYRLLADNVNDVIFVLDMDLNYTYVSPSVKLLRGYEPEEVLKEQSIEQTLIPSSQDLAMKTFSEIMEQEKTGRIEISTSWTLELEMSRKDGTTVWTEVKLSFIRDKDQRPVRIIGVTRDIAERKRTDETLRESEERFRILFENSLMGISAATPDGRLIYANLAYAQMYGYDNPEQMMVEITDIGHQLYAHPEERKKVLQIIAEKRIMEPREVEVIKRDGERFFVLVSAREVRDATGKLLYNQATHLDITKRKEAEEKLQQTLESLRRAVGVTIQVMVSAIETRDPYTAGHQVRSSDLARAIASEMGLSQERIEGIRIAGSIHDIGKLSIPAEMLSKPTKLSEIEFSLIKEHALHGYEILKNVESPWPLAEIVYQHHERMDGSGYPRKLKGNDILIEARILAVADVVEAVASHRPYRPSLGVDEALNEIEKNRGTLYDNTVVDTCLRLFREKGYQLQ